MGDRITKQTVTPTGAAVLFFLKEAVRRLSRLSFDVGEGGGEAVGVDEAADRGVVITALQVIEPGLFSVGGAGT